MAEPTGTARQEAERLVATVLAMASQAGLGGPPRDRDPDSASGRDPDPSPDASPSLGDMLTGLAGQVGQFLGGNPGSPSPTTRSQPSERDRQAERGEQAERDRQAERGEQAERDRRAERDRLSEQSQQAERDRQAQRRQQAEWGYQTRPGQPAADEPASGSGRGAGPGRDSAGQHGRGAGGLGAVWQTAGQKLWADVGRRNGWSTGSAECCICPVCRAIAGLRDPSPERAERLATGAGDFASSVAGMLRAFSVMTGSTGTSNRRKPPARPATTPDQAWSTATRAGAPTDRTPPEREVRESDDPWTAATRTPSPQPTGTSTTTTPAGAPPQAAENQPTAPNRPGASRGTTPAQPGGGQPAASTDAVAEPATAPTDATTRAAADQAAAQTDATGHAAPLRGQARPSGDPWAAATRTPPPAAKPGPAAAKPRPPAAKPQPTSAKSTPPSTRQDSAAADQPVHVAERTPAEQTAWTVTTDGAITEPTPEGHQPAAERADSTRGESLRDVAAAVEEDAARTGEDTRTRRGRDLTDNGVGNDTAGDTGVADAANVDHDVPGTAPAASAAEGRGAGSGDDARTGDAV